MGKEGFAILDHYTRVRAEQLDLVALETTSQYIKAKTDLLIRPFGLIPSATVLLTNATERTTSSLTYVKLKEIHMGISGFIRTSFQLKSVTGSGNASAQIYKNGVAFGTARVTSSANYQTYTEDLPFDNGDLYQIYVKHASGGANSSAVQNQLVCGSEGVGAITSGY